jgi:hypothetical protein
MISEHMQCLLNWRIGADSATILRSTEAGLSREGWYQQIVALLEVLENDDAFSIVDNGYRRDPGVLVTSGVEVSIGGRSFGIWSDMPGEIILVHPGMRASRVEQICQRLSELWAKRWRLELHAGNFSVLQA